MSHPEGWFTRRLVLGGGADAARGSGRLAASGQSSTEQITLA